MLASYVGRQNRVFGLDLMRAVAIMLVLFGHCAWIYPDGNGIGSQLMALAGYLGVEVFFVLSGYLIGGILLKMFLKGDFRLREVGIFLRRRWFRTLPNYYLVLIINIAIAGGLGYAIRDLWKYFFFLQNFAHPLLPFFPESWSLSVEEFAYLILPLALLPAGIMLTRVQKSRVFITVVMLLAVACFCAKALYHVNNGATSLAYWNLAMKSVVIFRLDAILYGVVAAWIHFRYARIWKMMRWPGFILGSAMLGMFTVGVGALGLFIDRYPFFWNVLYLPLTSFAFSCFLPLLSGWRQASVAIVYPVTFVSLVSYSVYLLHYSVILQLLKHFISTEGLSAPGRILFTLGYLAITFILSALLFRFFERPVMDLRDRLPQ